MTVAFYRWKETDQKTRERILRRAQADIDAVTEKVRPIIEDVRRRGDTALIDYAQKFEGADLSGLQATEEEFDSAESQLDDGLKEAIRRCARNVRVFHEEQMRRVEDRW
ncbi:MAG: histidinol dehydrogenase, partial [Alphaproteobacteria bacterium]|nr:histidinol dehydrogenase [Alphaproteobacteria bacterium]